MDGQLGCDMGDLINYVTICIWFGALVLVSYTVMMTFVSKLGNFPILLLCVSG
jgi:hypothetical protein